MSRLRAVWSTAWVSRGGGQLGEDPVAVFEGGLHRRGEAYGVAQVVHPVVGVAVGPRAGRTRSPSSRDFRLQRADFGERFGQFVEDRVDLRGVRCYVDGHLTGQHVALLPGGHQVAYRLGGPADHGGLREATTATTASLTPRAINSESTC